MNIICAFSSDSRDLYKADIYRVLALPKGHLIHFRYKKRYVDENLLNSRRYLKHQKMAIFFTHGNSINCENPELRNESIRWARIVHTEISNDTDVFHVYMALQNFCNVTIDSGNSTEKAPPHKFFSKLQCTVTSRDDNWQSRVDLIKEHFQNLTFFHLKQIEKKYCNEKIKYFNNNKSCRYELTHGNRYVIKMAIANPHNSNTKINISDSSDEISINCINPMETSIPLDDYDIPISVKTLQVMKQASLLKFEPINENGPLGEYTINIELDLKLSIKRPIVFGIFSVIAFWAVLIAKAKPTDILWPPPNNLTIATVMFFISASSLFFWFNKK
ncbi:hypothetical protein [Desulfoluna butyratoxydans]|uniref:Uncharacterized protein n=1 Tax=Desulfoluna butyratoxydans TaxID=231438 RepID=A0A4U8YZQ3_9BACT|nr:hypothetical protein [Desulfoluna butyratoxydans]VFQ47373.1 hypothetical protein MSL71_50730 [Desulfoluna butyratoxydans]